MLALIRLENSLLGSILGRASKKDIEAYRCNVCLASKELQLNYNYRRQADEDGLIQTDVVAASRLNCD